MNSTLYRALEWITRFAYINLLWVFFTLVGAVFFGLFPSTIAMFAIIRDWLRGEKDIPLFTSYWQYYKSEFWKSNRLGAFITCVTVFILIDIYFIKTNTTDTLTWTYIPLFAFMFLFILFLFYIFPVYVHYDLKVFHLIKNAFLIMLVHPINSLIISISLVSCYYIIKLVPALGFIFGGSIYAFITMWMGLNAFHKIQKKKEGHASAVQQ